MLEEKVDAKLATMYLRDVSPLWRAFWFHMHLMAKNLREFADGIGGISDEVFAYHVGGEKNDFARWVQEVIGDAALARALSGVGTKEEASAIVRERLTQLETAARTWA